MNYILPILLILLFLFCLIKKIPAYDLFVNGAKEGFDLVLSIFPYLVAIFIFAEIMEVSRVGDFLSRSLSPVLKFLGIPTELSKIVLLRPFSGSGSLALVEEIYSTYGADSYISRCASVIVGASDTVFYVIAIYLSTVKIKKMKYTLPVSLISMVIGIISSCFFVRLFS